MVSTLTRSDMSLIPQSYQELYENYYSFVVRLVARRGINRQNSEDVAQSILIKFWEKDAIKDYDPARLGRRGTPVMFGSFLGAFVLSYLPSHWHKQRKIAKAEMTLVNETDFNEEGRDAVPFLDRIGRSVEDDTSQVELWELSNSIRARLYLAEPTNAQDKCNLLELFDFINRYTAYGDKISISVIMEHFGVSKPTVQKWMKRLRAEIDLILQVV